MSVRKTTMVLLAALFGAFALNAAPASGASPAWKLVGIQLPSRFAPGEGDTHLLLIAANVGSAPTAGSLTLTDTLPAGLIPTGVISNDQDASAGENKCEISGQEVTCAAEGPVYPGRHWEVLITLDVDPLAPVGVLADQAMLSGGGATTATVDTSATISPVPASFGVLASSAPVTDLDGNAATLAGSHPFQLTASVGFPTETPNESIIGAGHPRDIVVDFPRGLIVNPSATPVLCTEAELVTLVYPGCPRSSQLGTVTVISLEGGSFKATTRPIYNMVPPPGTAAMAAFDAAGVGIYIHLTGELRSDGDYGISSVTPDALALTLHPVLGARAELWGDPSSPVHGKVRGACTIIEKDEQIGPCETEARESALLTLPVECTGKPILTGFAADSWEAPGVFERADYESSDLHGTPVSLSGCGELEYEPTIEARPTTNLADSPAGLKFSLHQPQETKLGARATAVVRDVTLTLSEGLVVNPAAAQGQQACSPAQIGLLTPVGQSSGVRFSKQPSGCPDAAKLGKVEVSSPLLAQTDAETKTKVQYDPSGEPIPRPLRGSVYLAEPFQNPFGSLTAIYLDVEDEESGIVAKLAAKVSPDPVTGRLTSTLTESPQLPLEDAEVSFFEGERAALRTPATCGRHQSVAALTPWSAGGAAHPADSFNISGGAGADPCSSSPGAVPVTAELKAGTENPNAGSYGPFVMRLSRPDGSQPISGFEARLPKGLVARLAGIPYCPEGKISQAVGRDEPGEGATERNDPSCLAVSQVGTLDTAAGAGPAPLHTPGKIYLAGPYKGAPLSFLAVVPAIAGPFDLGTVAVRSAVYLDPETALVRVLSDPLPQILQGIPLDLRAATVRIDRPSFVLNPTSCIEKKIEAKATTPFGSMADLSTPFQVSACQRLAFKPKLGIRLEGRTNRAGHPALRAVLRFPASGQANTDRAVVALPHSEFLDQAHIGTVCTRVQFAAGQCPAGAVYGSARAITPLLGEPLEGPVYLRSSSNPLPDLVVALKGQVDVNLVGRIDSVRGGIRTTFASVPDAPVSKFVISMRGGRKGLLENSTNLCARPNNASVSMRAQNGRERNFRALMQNDCKTKKSSGGGEAVK